MSFGAQAGDAHARGAGDAGRVPAVPAAEAECTGRAARRHQQFLGGGQGTDLAQVVPLI